MKTLCTLLAITVIVLCGPLAYSQDFSNKGRDFWVAYSGHIDGTTSRMALYITSDQDATGVVDINGSQIAFTVAANQVRTVQLTNTSNPSNSLAYNPQVEGVGAKRGIHITSDRPVVVYSHILNAARSGSTLVLPTNVLGKEYYVSSYKSTSAGATRRSQFNVVATLDNTTVEITPTKADGNGVRQPGVPFQVTLSKGDVYQYQSDEDLTGTYIKSIGTATASCQPIAVFAGSTFAAMGCTNAGTGDNLYQQLFPFASWGKVYYTAPFKSRAYDIFRIIVQDPNEPVYVNGTALNTATLISGRFYEINTIGNNTPRIITSNKPICVFQYMITMGCDGSNASDPEMVVLNAVEQTLNDITVMSARRDLTPPNTNITLHYLNIIFKTNTFSSLRVDGSPPAAVPIAIPGTNYSYIQEDVTAATNINPAHRITSDSGFICIAYGYGNVESYGYNAGTNVKDLYQFVTLQNQYATANFPGTCKNTPFYYSITLPYKATSLNWDFNNNPNLSPNTTVTNSAPVPDSSFVRDGRTLYVYTLPVNYTFLTTGTYPVKVTANNPTPDGCSGTQEINYDVVVFDPPKTDFSFTSNGCFNDTVRITDASNGNFRPIIKWMWDFGDKTIDSVKNPLKKYNVPGTYNIKLQTITDVGCIADTTKTITITAQPVAAFGISAITCTGQNITFTDSSTVSAAGIVKWTWNFGDGSAAVVNTTNAAVTHAYATPGTYNVSLEVETTTGCKSVLFTRQVTVHPNPVADFSFPNICLPSGLAQFTDLSVIADGSQSGFSYLWSFGDGDSSALKNPLHQYTSVGPFNAELTVTSDKGCVKDTIKVISTVYPQPKADFSVNPEVCLGDTSLFKDGSNSNGSAVVRWRWDFGDSKTDTIQHPKHLYTSAKTDSVKLFVYTDKGCVSDTMTKAVLANPLPTADFIISTPACETKQITITDKSVANAGNISSWLWDFGDSTTAAYTNPNAFTKTFTNWGTYTIKLSLQTDKGCKKDISKSITINPQPVTNFILPEVCLSDAFAQFTDSSYIADKSENAFTYAWNFGDANANASNPNTSTQKNPRHKYSAVGVYNVSLTVTSKDGCSTTLSQAFTVNGSIPIANFNVLNSNGLCSNTKVEIQNTSTVDFGSITKVEILWDVAGAPNVVFTDNNPAPNKIYSNSYPSLQINRTYQITFRAYSGGSCVNEITKTITVNASPGVSFTTLPGICFDASARQITQASETGSVPGSGAFSGTGISTTGVFNPNAAGAGTHTVQYLYTSTAGCKDSATQPITVWPSPVAKYSFSSPTCETNAITFTDASSASFSNIIQWKWNFNDGTTDDRTNGAAFNKTFAAAGNYNVSLQVITDSGCQSLPLIKTINVHPLPVVDFSLPAVCLPAGTAQFYDSSKIADGTQNQFTYLWEFGDPNNAATSTLKDPVHTYSSQGPFTVKLTVTSGNGCITVRTKQLTTVYQPPVADFTITPPAGCLGTTFNFADNSIGTSGNVTTWNWNLGDGTTAATQNTSRKYTSANTFNAALSVTNDKGCVSAITTKSVIVYPYPTVNAGPDLVVLSGGTAVLKPTVSGNNLSFRWSPSTWLDNSILQSPTTTPADDITYTLTVTAQGGCASSDNVFVKVLKAPTIPNAFSPNGDGINDVWNIEYLESYQGATVEVFNRYGKIVYRSAGYTKPWDGMMNGSPLPVGVYYYIVNPKNGRKQISGSVTILK